MEPQQVAEFASPRYFDKLGQHSGTTNHHHQPQASHVHHDGPAVGSSSAFIRPIVTAKSIEQAHEKKRTNNFLRSLLPARPSAEHEARRVSIEAPKKTSAALGQLFLDLPTELKIEVFASLPLADILSMRLVSRSWHAMVTLHELPIACYHLKYNIPAYAKRLYPAPTTHAINLHYVCGIWHRLHVAAKLAFLICEWITKEIFLRNTEEKRREFEVQRERMRRRLIPILFTMFHFFETYRKLHVEFIEEHGHGLLREPYTVNPIEAQIMNMYDDKTLLHVHQVFPLVVSSFCRRLRPPSYVGRVERSLRGYIKEKPSDEIYAAALCIGGLRQVERFWEIKGYNSRRGAVDVWYNSVSREPMEPAAKPRRSLLGGLTRKVSTLNVKDWSGSAHDSLPPVINSRTRRGSNTTTQCQGDVVMGGTTGPGWDSLVFSSSMSAGMPMTPLSREQARLVLADLPVLQHIWSCTAEALILDRRIVGRPQDIKRNAQVMLDLIQEGEAALEDEWWYGMVAPESVCPPLEAIDEDPIE